MWHNKSQFANMVYVLLSPVFVILTFSAKKSLAADLLQGKLAKCPNGTKENQLVHLPILVGNPCITCRCKGGSVTCGRERCSTKLCHGIIRRTRGKCCAECIEKSMCLHRHQTHEEGKTWLEEDCKICTCRRGEVQCSKQQCNGKRLTCPKGQKAGLVPGACCLQCIEATGTCTTYGDPHYQTFDNRMYNFQGSCKYLLTSDCRHGNFNVRVRNERRSSRLFSWTKHVAIHIGKTVITLYRNLEVRVNRTRTSLPFYDLPRLQITKSNFMLSVITDIGLQITWDGDSYTEVQVPIRFRGRLCGLCGNFNGKAKDDLKLRNGREAASIPEFGADWSVGKRRICNRAPAPPILSGASRCNSFSKRLRARRKCAALKSPVFSACYSKVKPNQYFKSCVTDMCECKSGNRCACASLMAYVRACRRQGVNLRWRRKTACSYLDYEASCKGGTVYSECVSPCSRTCDNLLDSNTVCDRPCVPGCQCPAGAVWHLNKCISTRKCLAKKKKKNPKLTGKRL